MATETAATSTNVKECRRLRAWELHQQGWSGRAIATALGMTPGTMSQWLKRACEQGVGAPRPAVFWRKGRLEAV